MIYEALLDLAPLLPPLKPLLAQELGQAPALLPFRGSHLWVTIGVVVPLKRVTSSLCTYKEKIRGTFWIHLHLEKAKLQHTKGNSAKQRTPLSNSETLERLRSPLRVPDGASICQSVLIN